MVTVILKVVEQINACRIDTYAEEHDFDSRAEAQIYVDDCIGDKSVLIHNVRPNGSEYWQIDYDYEPSVSDILEIRLL